MRIALAAAALILGLARIAAAEPTASDKEAARILFTEAKELRDAGKLAPALERFTRAHQLAATPITTVELARTHAMMGHLVEARRLYLSVDGLEKKPDESAKSLAARDEAKQLATDLDPRIPTIVVTVVPTTPIESASIDGKSVETSALAKPLAIDPGKHTIAVHAGVDASSTVTIAEGEHDRAVTIELPKPSPKVLPPPPPKPIAPTSSLPATMRYVGLATGGVGLIVGAVGGSIALSKASAVKDGCPSGICGPSRYDDLDATRRWATISTIGFGVAAVGATLFVIGIALPTSDPSKKDAARTLVPYASVTDRGGSFGLEGRF